MTRKLHLRTQWVAWLAMVGVLSPLSAATAAEPGQSVVARGRGPAIVDTALTKSGGLRGKVYNAQGTAMAGVDVFLIAPNGKPVRSRTNGDGDFEVDGLKGGVYQLAAGHGSQVVRAWSDGTAPPTAREQVLIVSNPRVVAGQYEPGTFGHFLQEAKYTLSNPLIVGGIIAAAVAIPVAIHNSNDDDGPTS